MMLLDRAQSNKSRSETYVGNDSKPLAGKSIAILFAKPSLRTRVSFQVGIEQLGGFSVFLGQQEVGLGNREPTSDVAKVLSGYVDCIVARLSDHQLLVDLAKYASVPVVNALSDLEPPCQIMADLLTIYEHKKPLEGLSLAYVGDGNNVARSLCLALPAVGINFTSASPKGYNLDESNRYRLINKLKGIDRVITKQQAQTPEQQAEEYGNYQTIDDTQAKELAIQLGLAS